MPKRWDIFCTVVDNYGDIGVCWRLARQLVHEHGLQVRLWVDDLASFQRLVPEIQATLATQWQSGVEIRRWDMPFPAVVPGDVIIEAFACQLPPSFVQAMAEAPIKPRWVNLEYLSAEDWVAEHHALPSPHPSLPLVKHFFFPGFGPNTGGLLREKGLLEQRSAFQQDGAAQADFWTGLGLPVPQKNEKCISLFAYENGAVGELLQSWVTSPTPIRCLVPEGRVLPHISSALGVTIITGQTFQLGALTLRVIPFLPQDQYDRLLWACDINFVRGEDSFVRAQWAGRPFVWQIYPQSDEAHWVKLNAFLALYSAQLAPAAADALTDLWQAWNRQMGMAEAWHKSLDQTTVLSNHARQWSDDLARQKDLVTRLVQFCEKPL